MMTDLVTEKRLYLSLAILTFLNKYLPDSYNDVQNQ